MTRARTWALGVVTAVALLGARPATAGKFFDPGAGLSSPVVSADCGRGQRPSTDPIPTWSRLTWSLQTGVAIAADRTAAVIVPQAGWALWLRESVCASGTGLFSDDLWRRWSLAIGGDAVVDPDAARGVLRPTGRLARTHMTRGLLSFGSEWTASTELFATAGPTFDPAWRGGAVSVGGRASVVAVELRVDATADGEVAVLLLGGLTDLHGLWRLGPRRTL